MVRRAGNNRSSAFLSPSFSPPCFIQPAERYGVVYHHLFLCPVAVMIAELLEPGKIVFGLSEDFSQALETLCHYSSLPDLAARFRSRKLDPSNEGYSYIGDRHRGTASAH
jgi:hypothetical protein